MFWFVGFVVVWVLFACVVALVVVFAEFVCARFGLLFQRLMV